jgi:hypothetical protein
MVELSDLAVEALAAQLSVLDLESDTHNLWWHQLPADVQAEYRKKATLQITYWQRQSEPPTPPKTEKPYDFDDAPWKRWKDDFWW